MEYLFVNHKDKSDVISSRFTNINRVLYNYCIYPKQDNIV